MDSGNGMNQDQRQKAWPDYNGSGYGQSYLSNYLHPAYQYALRVSLAARYLLENCPYLTTPSLLETLITADKTLSQARMSSSCQPLNAAQLQQFNFQSPSNNSDEEAKLNEIRAIASHETGDAGWANTHGSLTAPQRNQNSGYSHQPIQEESVQIVKIEQVDAPLPEERRAPPIERQTFSQKKGPVKLRPVEDIALPMVLSKSEREAKIALYRQKRKRRIFAKKVSYDCRKKVADQRIRIKGRFVTKQQALELLELGDAQLTIDRIKVLLRQRMRQDGAQAVSQGSSLLTNLKLE